MARWKSPHTPKARQHDRNSNAAQDDKIPGATIGKQTSEHKEDDQAVHSFTSKAAVGDTRNRFGKLWRYDNIFVADNSVIETSNAGNPTFMMVSQALRTADRILGRI